MRQYAKDAGRLITYVFMFVMICIYPFYAPDGYNQITTNKFHFLQNVIRLTAGLLLVCGVVYFLGVIIDLIRNNKNNDSFRKDRILDRVKAVGQTVRKKWMLTDTFVAGYFIAVVLSYLFSDFRNEAFWGTDGWYMGLTAQLFFCICYFVVSRLFRGERWFLLIFPIVSFFIFLWGILNRFQIYPVNMLYHDYSFISCIGNINWYCGYYSSVFAVGVVCYFLSDKNYQKVLSGIYCMIAFAAGITQGSDSAFLALLVVFLFLLFFVLTNHKLMEMIDLIILFFIVCQIIRVARILWPDAINLAEQNLNILTIGNFTLICLVLTIAFRIMITVSSSFLNKIETVGVRNTIFTVFGIIFIGMILLIVINTYVPSLFPGLSQIGFLNFNNEWGSGRGATWRAGFRIFNDLPFGKKLIGVGPDCFSAYTYNVPKLAEIVKTQFENNRLTNAHGEWITILADCGLFGLITYAGIFISSFFTFYKEGKRDAFLYIFAASILSYTLHNFVSFQQIVNTPFIFILLGLGQGYLRHLDEHRVPRKN